MINFLIILAYFTLLLWVISKWSFFKSSGIRTRILQGIFVLKFLIGVALTSIYTNHYQKRNEADIFKYYDDAKIMYGSLKTAPEDYFKMLFSIGNDNDYFYYTYYVKMNNWDRKYDTNIYNDSHTIIRLNALLMLISFGVFHVHTLFFCMISLIGLVALYRWSSNYVRKNYSLIIAIFLIPSVLFWTSGVLKEAILVFGLGMFLFASDHIFKQKFNWKNAILLLFSLVLLFYIKFYVLIAFIPCIIAYLISKKTQKLFPLIYVGTFAIFTITAFNAEKIPPHIDFVETLVRKQTDFKRLVSYQGAGSEFDLTSLEPSFTGVAKVVPEAIINCFIRPLPSKKTGSLQWITIFENLIIIVLLILLVITIVKHRFQFDFDASQRNTLWFAGMFTLTLFVIIGLTTPVAGALVRYKVPALPFLGIFILSFLNLEPQLQKIIPFKLIES